MKQFLFATTAIVATTGFAGIAAAQTADAGITLSGSAEMGIFAIDVDDDDGDDGDIQFHTDIDVTFTMAGATDGGLVYGASIDLDESDGDGSVQRQNGADDVPFTDDDTFSGGTSPAFANDDQGGEEIFISGGFGTLTMGDTDGALDWALAEVGFNATAINDDHEHAGWNGNSGLDGTFDGQILRYDYTIGDYAIALSGEIDDDDKTGDGTDPILGVGFRGSIDFAGNSVGFGIGYQTGDDGDGGDNEAYGASVNTTLAGFQVGLTFMNVDDEDDGDDDGYEHYGIGVGYGMGPLALHANYGKYDFDGDEDNASGYGLTAGYDLGDDVQLQLGYGNSNGDGGNDREQFSFGVSMSF